MHPPESVRAQALKVVEDALIARDLSGSRVETVQLSIADDRVLLRALILTGTFTPCANPTTLLVDETTLIIGWVWRFSDLRQAFDVLKNSA
jgi:hypothetical protein